MTDHTSSPGRTVLLCGAQGFVGQALRKRLKAQGWNVRSGSRRSQPPVDYARQLKPADWFAHLQGVHAVINAVGHLRGSAQAPLESIHAQAPMALFDACAELGIRQVMQLSALGVDGNETPYARTKRAADQHLQGLTDAGRLDGVIVRPSVVIGAGGASTQLFMRLSVLPVLTLPKPMFDHLIQPLLVDDLADAMLALMQSGQTGIVELGGSQRLSMADTIASLRAQRGLRPAFVRALPDWVSHASARLGDAVPASPWCSASLVLASHDNCCDPSVLPTWLGRDPVTVEHMLRHIKTQS
ncbi:MAG: NAD-dependent epimerase/dehydratase family protein [Comamonadaceae bacterium]|nr:NAD-dependent epimerase/dehydratase family protein [Comamonadaceae bacterium]